MDEHERILRYGIPGWIFFLVFVWGSFIQYLFAEKSSLFVEVMLQALKVTFMELNPAAAIFLIAAIGVLGIPFGFIIGQFYHGLYWLRLRGNLQRFLNLFTSFLPRTVNYVETIQRIRGLYPLFNLTNPRCSRHENNGHVCENPSTEEAWYCVNYIWYSYAPTKEYRWKATNEEYAFLDDIHHSVGASLIAIHLAGLFLVAANFLPWHWAGSWIPPITLIFRIVLPVGIISWFMPFFIFVRAQRRTTEIIEGFIARALPDYLPRYSSVIRRP